MDSIHTGRRRLSSHLSATRRSSHLSRAEASQPSFRPTPCPELASAAARAHRAHLPRALPSAPLARDLLLLASGVRSAVLWDHWALADGDGDDGSVGVGAPLTAEHVCRFVSALRESAAAARPLALVAVGPSLFLAHSELLARRLRAEEAAGDAAAALSDLVAADEALPAPRACTAVERARVCAAVGDCRRRLLEALAAAASERGGEAPLIRLAAPPGGLLVAIHGWLLEYPVVYCLGLERAAAAAAAANCLGGQPLVLLRLTARHPPEPEPQLVCAFSLPVCVVRRAAARAAERRPLVARAQARLAASSWRGAALDVEAVTLPVVAL